MRRRRVTIITLAVSAAVLGGLVAALILSLSGSNGPPSSPTARLSAGAPSGEAMPTTNPRGWTRVFSDNFTEPSLAADPQWSAYSGAPGGDPGGWWNPTHDVVANGELRLRGYRDPSAGGPAGAYVTGGLASRFAQTYGSYLVRFRMDQGQGVSLVALLWPASKQWPPEIDLAEDNGADPRTTNTASLHYGSSDAAVVRTVPVDLTQWHTLGVQWEPGSLTYTLDGHPWATVDNSNVPDIPMTLDLQTQAWNCGGWQRCPNSSTPAEVDMDVDWVVAYRRS